MKKVLLFLSFIFAFAVSQAQDYTLRYGAKAGLNYASQYSSGYEFSAYHGYTLGVFAEVYKSDLKNLFLRGGINYAQRGVKYNNDETKNQYVEIPIQVGYKYSALKFMNVYALLGPYVDIRTYGNGYMKGFGNQNIKTKNFAMGAQGGIGFEFLKHYQLEANYQLGFLPNYKGGDFSGKNNTFMITLGMAF